MSHKGDFKAKYTIRVLSKHEFDRNSSFYQKSFDEITISQNPDAQTYDNLTDFTKYFKLHPINSIVYIQEGERIVSFMYASPLRDYESYNYTDLEHWGVNYIKTHKDFECNGYAYMLTIAGLQDMAKKGAKRVDFLPNQNSLSILERVIDNNNIGELTNSKRLVAVKTVIFNPSFIKMNNSLDNHEEDKEI